MSLYLPYIEKHSKVIADVYKLADLIMYAAWQERAPIYIDLRLMLAAQRKAEDMAKHDYFAHTNPFGFTANENVRAAGYKLPDYYSEKGNQVESLYIGHDEPEEAVKGWLESSSHHDHIAGRNDFYRGQPAIGVGTAVAQDGRQLWVFISAPGMN